MKTAGVQTSLLLVALGLMTLFAFSEAYGTGAPQSACGDGTPGHLDGGNPIDPQTGDSPYSFTFEGTEYNPGGNLQVTISIAEGTTDFQGFLLQARQVTGDAVVGTFTAPETEIGQLLECSNPSDTVTHSNTNSKSEQTFTWHAPADLTGEIQFFGTVATNHDIFYVGIRSDTLAEGDAVTEGPTTTGEPTTKMTTEEVTMTTADEPTTKMTTEEVTMTTADAVKLSTGFGTLLLAALLGALQLFA